MNMRRNLCLSVILVIGAICSGAGLVLAEDENDNVARIRNSIQQLKAMGDKYKAAKTDPEYDALDKETDALWKEILVDKETGARMLIEELEKEKDNQYFLVDGSALLLRIATSDVAKPKMEDTEKSDPFEARRIAEAQIITPLCNALVKADLAKASSMNQFFDLCHVLARSANPQVFPVIDKFLANKDKKMFLAQHFLNVEPRDMLTLIYGVYGRSASKHLLEVLQKSTDVTTRKNAILMLATFKYDPAALVIRQIASNEKTEFDLRATAVKYLGRLADPKDLELFKKLLKDKNPEMRYGALFSLYELELPSTVPLIIPLVSDTDEKVQGEAAANLSLMMTPSGAETLVSQLAKEKSNKAKEIIKKLLGGWAESGGSNQDEFLNMKAPDRAKVITKALEQRAQKYNLQPGDKKLTHDELLEAAREWKAKHAVSGGAFQWVEDRHLLDAAAVKDLDLLFEIRAAICWRVSDESLGEISLIDDLIRRIHKRQFKY